MKTMSKDSLKKLFAIGLSLMMVIFCLASCGSKETTTTEEGTTSYSMDGTERNWGYLEVFVPSDMELKGGTETDGADDYYARIYDKSDESQFFAVQAVDEVVAEETMTQIKQDKDAKELPDFTVGDRTWSGVTYNDNGTTVFTVQTTDNNKVLLVTGTGYAYDDDISTAILDSLKYVSSDGEEL